MTKINKKQYITDVRVMIYLFEAIPNDIYNSMDAYKTAQEIKGKRIARIYWSKYVIMVRHNQTGDTVSYDQLYDSLLQFKPHIQASKAKRAARNHDLLALLSHSSASSQSHARAGVEGEVRASEGAGFGRRLCDGVGQLGFVGIRVVGLVSGDGLGWGEGSDWELEHREIVIWAENVRCNTLTGDLILVHDITDVGGDILRLIVASIIQLICANNTLDNEEPIAIEPNTSILNENANELVQEDVAELDGNVFYNPLQTSAFKEAESSSTYQDLSNMHEFHQTHHSTNK
ncbi:hypothetical protein Tco_0986392 [Tanacetum coccineum]